MQLESEVRPIIRRLVAAIAIVLFSVLAYTQERSESANANKACELCETPFHKVYTAPQSFIKGAYVTSVPSLDGYYPVSLEKEPMVLDIVVDSSGVACSLKIHKNGDAKVLSKLSKALKSWKFRTPKYNGKDICLQSQLLVYVRRNNDESILFIPGVSDRSK